jgi:mediator of RNA polymerase II transcription subunit 31
MSIHPPSTVSPRFTLELEFVLSLSNPLYLQHLATTHPNLFNGPRTPDSDAIKFAAYLKYLYEYWRTPEYAKFLTHPGAVLNTLRLLQEEQFLRDVIRPDVVEALLRGSIKADVGEVGVQEGEQAAVDGNGERRDEGAG